MKLAVVLFNLGGPDSLQSVGPFLRNLFSDPAIISLPAIFRTPLAAFIAGRRTKTAQHIYAQMGGRSPIVEETEAQAGALESALSVRGIEARAFIAMRYWKPLAHETAKAVKDWAPDRVVLLPLYPQYSTTTTASSLKNWYEAAKTAGLAAPTSRVCCYPWSEGFVEAAAGLIRDAMAERKPELDYRLLLSAHGLPKRIVEKGDPYQWQVERTAAAIVQSLDAGDLDWSVCYQSRVGPLDWIGPATDTEIARAAQDGKSVIVFPIAFVSEHSETLVELDIEYRGLADSLGVADYIRVRTVGVQQPFINALAQLVERAATGKGVVTCSEARLCPASFARCGFS